MYFISAILAFIIWLIGVNIYKLWKEEMYYKTHPPKYKKGDKVIFHQANCYYNRLVGCEIIQVYEKNRYKVKAYTDTITLWVLPEKEIECTADELGYFPSYNKPVKIKF